MVDIQMPQLGETVTEGTITRWFKQVGDQVAEDEPLFEVSTDKVDSEVPSPVSGTLTEILVQEGETVEVGAVLARVGDAPAGDGGGAATEAAAPAEAPEPAEPAPEPAPANGAAAGAAPGAGPAAGPGPGRRGRGGAGPAPARHPAAAGPGRPARAGRAAGARRRAGERRRRAAAAVAGRPAPDPGERPRPV